ncbi:MAG: tetratricopeptide repeat protein [Planctomycetota bacterium]|nr:tetratricopeptide repeat protein [Planctomycetota bacterium]
MFRRLFGKKSKLEPPIDANGAGGMIEAYDQQGNKILIERSEYRTSVLSGTFNDAWNDADDLYGAIVMALNDGFLAETIAPAERLRVIDPIVERSTTILGIVLMKNNEFSRAEKVLSDYLKEHDSGVVATNLAKVYDEQGRKDESRTTLRRALSMDPNQDNGIEWFGAIAREEGGDEAYLAAMRDIAKEPGSWRAQLWIAREFLEHDDAQSAIQIYKQLLNSADVAEDGIMMISGDLGNNGYIEEIIDLFLPVFDVHTHGIQAGLNLVQACIESGRKHDGLRICDDLLSLNRYDLKQIIDERRAQLRAMH